MVNFINIIIYYSMSDILVPKDIYQKALSASLNKSNEEFTLKLYKDSNFVVFKTQIHFFSHNVTCFKYGVAISRKCQFNFLRLRIDKIRVIELKSIDISQNHLQVNPWNPALASVIRLNHDINFIPSNVKALVFVCYITNYVSKRNYSQYQYMMGVVFV